MKCITQTHIRGARRRSAAGVPCCSGNCFYLLLHHLNTSDADCMSFLIYWLAIQATADSAAAGVARAAVDHINCHPAAAAGVPDGCFPPCFSNIHALSGSQRHFDNMTSSPGLRNSLTCIVIQHCFNLTVSNCAPSSVFGGKGDCVLFGLRTWLQGTRMSASVADALDRVSQHKGVLGLMIAGFDGSIHKTTLDEQLTQEYSSRLPQLTALARNIVRELEPQDDLEFLRVRSAKHEVLIAPRADYVLIVIQEAS